MARDHARIRIDLWTDDDWRSLTQGAQWLYMYLLTQSELTFAGTCDWRPARIAAKTADLRASDVEYFAGDLEREHFVVIDRDAEEVLIRSFAKHDGLLKSPNMVKALIKAHGEMSSATLRAVVVGQLQHLAETAPAMSAWRVSGMDRLLSKASLTVPEAFEILPRNPSLNPSGTPSADRPELTNSLPHSLLTPSLSSSKVRTTGHQGAVA